MMMMTAEDWEAAQHLQNRMARKGLSTWRLTESWTVDFHDALFMAWLMVTPIHRRDLMATAFGRPRRQWPSFVR